MTENKTIYVITSGIYDDYHIETVTDSKEVAEMLDEMHIGSAEEWKIESLEDVKIKYEKWKATNLVIKEWLQKVDLSLHESFDTENTIRPPEHIKQFFANKFNGILLPRKPNKINIELIPLNSLSVKEHIEPGGWVAVNQNGEAIKGDAPNKLKK